jgi:predicted metal-dependent HD superfamily phosphohydrolase
MHWLNSVWHRTAIKYSNNIDLIEDTLNGIIRSYSEKHRYYHTLNHIESMLELSREHMHKLKFKDETEMAILYHDIVYDPGKSDNEEKSASRAEMELQSLQFPPDVIEYVCQLILATRDHDIGSMGAGLKKDAAFFLDFDLAILGAESAEYHRYAKAIRKEFSIFPDTIYKQGRIRVLQSFLKKENIYFTEDFRAHFENQARENLTEEMKELNR